MFIDVVYADLWQRFVSDGFRTGIKKLTWLDEKKLYFPFCPVVIYETNSFSEKGVFDKIIPYIDALDFLVTGNSNDVEKLADAILVMTKFLKEEDLKNLGEVKALMGIEKDERVEYLTKNFNPAFREYVTKLLIQEIHKHSHVVDWYSPDSGLTGDVSAKALKTRLFDMNMFSNKIEKFFRYSFKKRIDLIAFYLRLKGLSGEYDIKFNRVLPDDFETLAPIINNLSFISDETKLEMLGINVEAEKARLSEQRETNMEMMENVMRQSREEKQEEI